MEIKGKDFKNFINGKSPLVIETTTVGALKSKIKENQQKTYMGQGFKAIEEADEIFDKKPTTADKGTASKSFTFPERNISGKGSAMLGDGFLKVVLSLPWL